MEMKDDEQLNLLAIFHYVVAGLAALFSLFPLIHLGLGLPMVFAPQKFDKGEPPPAFVGWMFVALAAVIIVFGIAFATLTFFAGRSIAKRKRYTFCLVMAAIECLFMPFGTVLGIFTIIVLIRDPVKQQFTGQIAAPPVQ
jgi:hypothetical protein